MKIRLLLMLFICFSSVSCKQEQETQPTVEKPERKEPELNQEGELIIAAFNLETDRVKELLEAGVDPNATFDSDDLDLFEDQWLISSYLGFENWTPLIAVASSLSEPQPAEPTKNTSELPDAAQREGDVIDPRIIEERERSRVKIAELLIDAGADLDAGDGFGATALACSIDNGYEDLALLLIESGADPNTKTGVYIDGPGDVTPLHDAAFYPKVLAALLEHGADVNVVTSKGDTPLHYATLAGEIESVRLLIAAGVDVNARNKQGELASRWGSSNPEMQKLLKEAEEKSANRKDQP